MLTCFVLTQEESSLPGKPVHPYKGSPDRSNHGAREYANDHFKQVLLADASICIGPCPKQLCQLHSL